MTLGTGFFVASEFALVAVDRATIDRLAEEGRRGARQTRDALTRLSFELSGAQLGITVTALLTGFIVEPTLGRALEPVIEAIPVVPGSSKTIAVGLGLVLATALQMVLGELVPKNLAVARPVDVALVVSGPFALVNKLWKPLILLLNASANQLVRLLGIQPRDELESVYSLEELEVLIRSSREEGSLREPEFSLLTRSLSFGNKIAADALTPRVNVAALEQGNSIEDMAALAVRTGHSRFPVYAANLDHVVGVVHVKDIYAVTTPLAETSVVTIMSDPLFVPESKPLDALLIEMRREGKQLAVVLDEYAGTAGIVTLEDLLEEIVGDIEDEYDASLGTPVLTSPSSGIHTVSAALHPDELYEATGLRIPEGDYDTFAGFLLTLFDRIPHAGDHLSFRGWELKVIEMDKNRIGRVLVVGPSSTTEEVS